jgi:K+-sensing histidine kinase KdpD
MKQRARVLRMPGPARCGVMVCLSPNASGAEILIRKAARAADDLGADWYAVHVDTRIEDKNQAPGTEFRALLDAVVLAADMGVEAVWLKAPDTPGRCLPSRATPE